MAALDFDALVAAPVLEAFGDVAQLGGPATYTPQAGAAFTIDGVFDAAWRELEFRGSRHGASLPVSTTKPAFAVRLSDFPAGVEPALDDTLVRFNGETYRVGDIRPDGVSGSTWTYLILN